MIAITNLSSSHQPEVDVSDYVYDNYSSRNAWADEMYFLNEWTEPETGSSSTSGEYPGNDFLKVFLPPVLAVGMLLNAVVAACLARPRMWRDSRICIYLSAICLNNTLMMSVVYGLYWLYLMDPFNVFVNTVDGLCKSWHFFTNLIHFNILWLVSAALLDCFLRRQLLPEPTPPGAETDSGSIATTTSLPTGQHSLTATIARWYCKPRSSLIVIACQVGTLALVSLPNTWMFRVVQVHRDEHHYCTFDFEKYSAATSYGWMVVFSTLVALVFYLTVLILVPLIVCCPGIRRSPSCSERQVFEYSPVDGSCDTDRSTKLTVYASVILWTVEMPLTLCHIFWYFEMIGVQIPVETLITTNTAFQMILLVCFVVWPLACVLVLPPLRREFSEPFLRSTKFLERAWGRYKGRWIGDGRDRHFVQMENVEIID